MLLYRFPGKNIVRKSGSFIPCEHDALDGFVISNFTGTGSWRFQEDEQSDLLFLKQEHLNDISREDYLLKASQLVNAIRSLGLKKVVYSRIQTDDFDTSFAKELFYTLEEKYTEALVYFFSDKNLGTWIGASPEILFEQHGKCGITTSLAGTKEKDDTNEWRVKEILEQEYVSHYIFETLTQLGINNIETHGPYDYFAGPVKHLKTDFLFECSVSQARELLRSLHPTPAVCGLPKDFAAELISQIEDHDRELYTGFIGEITKEQTKLFVNLRCAKLTTGKIHYFLGGGFTKDSVAEQEWIETENKRKTLADLVDLL